MANETTTYLKYALLQMAAEAIDWNRFFAGELTMAEVLVAGNGRNSKFTATQAADFASKYEVVAHQSNTPTGFSGTLFRDKVSRELIICFRSTEFLDDAARDNQATNSMEVKPCGWAVGGHRNPADRCAKRFRRSSAGNKRMAHRSAVAATAGVH